MSNPDIITCATDKASLVTAAWTAANLHANALDRNSQHSIALLAAQMVIGALPAAQCDRIIAYGAWWRACWDHYAEVLARIDAGEVAFYDPASVGPCPWTIWDLAQPPSGESP